MPTLLTTTLGQFCRELSIQLSPVPTLLAEWGLTEADFAALRESAGYKHEMAIVARELAELGSDGGYIFRMKALSEIFIKDIVNIMQDPETPRSTKVELIKFTAEMARVKQLPQTAGVQDARFQGPSVVFHFASGLPIQSMRVTPDPITVDDVQEIPALTTKKGFQIDSDV